MSLIDNTYFVRERALPENKYNSIQDFINRYENRIIYSLLGYELGKLVIAYNEASEQRIKDIVEGKEYTISNDSTLYTSQTSLVKVKWNGLKNSEKESLIADWVFYWWCREADTPKMTNSGGAKAKLENAVNVGYAQKAVNAWNNLYYLYGYEDQPKVEPSAYNFLSQNKTVYPEWVFKHLGTINAWSL